jgi:hypothetical protein
MFGPGCQAKVNLMMLYLKHDTHSLPIFPQELSIAVAIVSKVQKTDCTAMYTHFFFYICYFIVFAPAKSAVIINHIFGNKD